MMSSIKAEKLEPNDGPMDVARNSAQREVRDLAAYMGISLESMQAWSFKEKHMWLKCMLLRHLEPERILKLHWELVALEIEIQRHPDLALDDIVQLVEAKLGFDLAAKLRCGLAMWRQTATIEAKSRLKSRQRSGNRGGGGSVSGGGDLLWQHILRLLMTRDPAVRWMHPAHLGYFQFVRSSAAAKSWGRTKNNENMSFEKMSRSIRQYYRQHSGVIQKVPSKARLQYKFNMSHPDVMRFIFENFPQCLDGSGNGMQQHQQQQHQQQQQQQKLL